jgi:hypothetical protein
MAHPLTQQCEATSKATGQRCRRRVTAAPVCAVHGQNANVKASRERRLVEFEARQRGEPLDDR